MANDPPDVTAGLTQVVPPSSVPVQDRAATNTVYLVTSAT